MLYAGITPPISTTSFCVHIIAWWHVENKGVGSFGFLKVLVLQWNNHQCFLIYVHAKVIQNISRMAPKHSKCYIFIHTKIYSLKDSFSKKENCSERPHLASRCLVKVFYKTTTCSRQLPLSGPKSGCFIYIWRYKATTLVYIQIQWDINLWIPQ